MAQDITKYYPPVGFHFMVEGVGDGLDICFQSVSGLSAQIQTETWKEGGENRFEHTLPVRTKYSDLVLKRGVFKPGTSGWTDWFKEVFTNMLNPNSESEGPFIKPRDLTIKLLNENHEPLMTWKVVHAWPKNWKLADLNAERGEVLIETLELNYNYFELT